MGECTEDPKRADLCERTTKYGRVVYDKRTSPSERADCVERTSEHERVEDRGENYSG